MNLAKTDLSGANLSGFDENLRRAKNARALHFSDLKRYALSPAHYAHHVETPFEPTRDMRIGTIVDAIMFGTTDKLAVYAGTRRGKEWESFQREAVGKEIVTATEWDEAEPIAVALRNDQLAVRYLTGRHQVPLEWDNAGVRCATRGIDVVGNRWISDLKVTNSAQPSRLTWHAQRMLWHAQLAWYDDACAANDVETSEGLYLVCVESSAPYPVTVLRMSKSALEQGAKLCASWLERHKRCIAAQQWPGYVQSVVDLDVEQTVELEGLADE